LQVFEYCDGGPLGHLRPSCWGAGFGLLALAGCIQVGPDYTSPEAPLAADWQKADDQRVATGLADDAAWWRTLNDPVLSALIEMAPAQNPTVQIAGVRVLQARAQLGAAIGELYPQQQQATAEVRYEKLSDRDSSSALLQEVQEDVGNRGDLPSLDDRSFWITEFGIGAAWELDLWGKFRRSLESADADLLASIASYDDALVSLTAEVASAYVNIRTFEERLRVTRENAQSQADSLRLTEVRFRDGETDETDVEQARSEYAQTRSKIPQYQTGIAQNQHALSVLLGMPPTSLDDRLQPSSGIPKAPAEVAIGIPADLLRRRPDIRSAEQKAAAQSALIGVTQAQLYPAFSLSGSFGFASSDIDGASLSDAFKWSSRTASFGPAVSWNLFNYGQITNQVRAQDASFQEAILSYQNTVLQAQQEVEDALASFLGAQDSAALLTEAVAAGERSVELALVQYREGATDYTTVLSAQQNLLEQQDQLAVTQGDIAQGMISLYRALGGGWQTHRGQDFVRDDIKEVMAARTDWGRLLQDTTPAAVEQTTVPLIPVPEF
jgi:NodT family efflux transporter outer membrane factor (OMF) lipoprotein